MPDLKLIKDIEPEEINEQIQVRFKLLDKMVGTLYPTILSGEIEQLEEIRAELIGEVQNEIER